MIIKNGVVEKLLSRGYTVVADDDATLDSRKVVVIHDHVKYFEGRAAQNTKTIERAAKRAAKLK